MIRPGVIWLALATALSILLSACDNFSTPECDPAIVNADPQGAGWFFKLRLADAKAMNGLMDEAAYKKLTE